MAEKKCSHPPSRVLHLTSEKREWFRCQDCGKELTKYRFEIAEHRSGWKSNRICPQCVLMPYINKASFWQLLNPFYKPKFKPEDILEII